MKAPGPGRRPSARRLLGSGLLRRLPRWVQDQVVLRALRLPPSALDGLVVKLAETPEEHDAAARLTFEAFADRGLVDERGVPVRVTPFLLLPTTTRFVALKDGEVIGTLSLILDSPLGLPMECIFADQLNVLRAKGTRLAEVGALAIKKAHRGYGVAMLLYKAMWSAAVTLLGVERLVVAVHPDAVPAYTSPLRFTALSTSVRRYPGLKDNALAVGLQLDLVGSPSRYRRDFEHLGPALFNPWRFFVETTHPHIQLPSGAGQLTKIRASHQQAALRLASLRPDVLLTMKDQEFQVLQQLCESTPTAATAA